MHQLRWKEDLANINTVRRYNKKAQLWKAKKVLWQEDNPETRPPFEWPYPVNIRHEAKNRWEPKPRAPCTLTTCKVHREQDRLLATNSMYRPREFRAYTWPVRSVRSFPDGLLPNDELKQPPDDGCLDQVKPDTEGVSTVPMDITHTDERKLSLSNPGLQAGNFDVPQPHHGKKRNLENAQIGTPAVKVQRYDSRSSSSLGVKLNEVQSLSPSTSNVGTELDLKYGFGGVDLSSRLVTPSTIKCGEKILEMWPN